MKILRNKTYSDSDNETPKKVGEAIGTALVGTAGTVGATDLIKRGAKKYITSQESKKAKKAFKEGIKKLDDTVNGDLQDILDRFEVIQSDDVMYTTFTDRSGDMDGNVKFIFESDPIEISDDEKQIS